MHVKKGDRVQVISGRNIGERGIIKQALPSEDRVIVENINIVKKHMKPRGPRQKGGIIEVEAPLHVSNVMLVCPHCDEPVRTGHRFLDDGTKVRFCKNSKCNKTI